MVNEGPLFCDDLWVVIGSFIGMNDYGTLLTFIGLSRSSIQFICPTLIRLFNSLLYGASSAIARELVYYIEISRDSFIEGRKPDHLKVPFAGFSLNRAEGWTSHFNLVGERNVVEWRPWISELLSILHLWQLHQKHNLHDFKEKPPSPQNQLCTIYYRNPVTFEIQRLDRDPRVKTIQNMPSKLGDWVKRARKYLDHKVDPGLKEIIVGELSKANSNCSYAIAYHAMEPKVKLDKATSTACFRQVVVAPTMKEGDGVEHHYKHIYNKYDKEIKEIRDNCFHYDGVSSKQFQRQLHLRKNWVMYVQRCETRITTILPALRKKRDEFNQAKVLRNVDAMIANQETKSVCIVITEKGSIDTIEKSDQEDWCEVIASFVENHDKDGFRRVV